MERFSINIRKQFRKQTKGMPSRSENVSPSCTLETNGRAIQEPKPIQPVTNIQISLKDLIKQREENVTSYLTLQGTVTELKPTLQSEDAYQEEPFTLFNEKEQPAQKINKDQGLERINKSKLRSFNKRD